MMSQTRAAGCPDSVVDWIAWYSEGLLPEPARGRIEAHAAECGRCRHEIAMMRGDEAPEVPALPDADAVFGRVLGKIEAAHLDSTTSPRATRREHTVAPQPLRRTPERATRSSRTQGWRGRALAAAAGLALVAGTIGLIVGTQNDDPRYATASAGGETRAQIDAVFSQDASLGTIQAGLRSVGASIVSGPSPGGRFGVALPEGSDPEATAALLREQLGGAALLIEPSLP